jgi:hypothetical protein
VVSRVWRELKEAERVKSRIAHGDAPEVQQADPRAENREGDQDGSHKDKGNVVSDRRAARRRTYQFLLLVYGSDAEKQPFHEETETLDISEDGCSFSLETAVVRGQRLFLANKVNQAELAARVVHVGRRVSGKTSIGVEFLRAAPEFWLTD